MEKQEAIDPKELRSGNLIIAYYESEDDTDIHETISEFKFYDCYNNYYFVESVDGVEEFSGFKPIPLTEDWLLKFGFEKGILEDYYQQPNVIPFLRDGITEVMCKDGKFYIAFDGVTPDETPTLFNISVELKNVHELQNAYPFFFGEELRVNHNQN